MGHQRELDKEKSKSWKINRLVCGAGEIWRRAQGPRQKTERR